MEDSPVLLQYIRSLEANTESIKVTLARMEERLNKTASQAEQDAINEKVAAVEKTVLLHSFVGKSVGAFLTLAWGGLLAFFSHK